MVLRLSFKTGLGVGGRWQVAGGRWQVAGVRWFVDSF